MITRPPFKLAYLPALLLVILAAVTSQSWVLIPAFGYVAVVVVLVGAANIRVTNQRQRYRRWLDGRCVYCGYSLKGNVSGVCPECGKRIPEQAPSQPAGSSSVLEDE